MPVVGERSLSFCLCCQQTKEKRERVGPKCLDVRRQTAEYHAICRRV